MSRGINWGKNHSGRKTILIFSKFWAKFFFCYCRKITGMVVETAIYVSFQGFEGKPSVLKIEHYSNLLRTLRWKKMGHSVRKYFSGFSQQKFALPEKCVDENKFRFRKSFLFLLSFLEFEWFLCLFAKLFSQVCQITDQCAERNKLGNLIWKSCFFNHFWKLRQKNLDFPQNSQAWFSKP